MYSNKKSQRALKVYYTFENMYNKTYFLYIYEFSHSDEEGIPYFKSTFVLIMTPFLWNAGIN